MTQLVHRDECLLNLVIDPGFLAIVGDFRTFGDNMFKRCITCDLKTIGAQNFAKRTRHAEFLKRHDRSAPWFHPEYFWIFPVICHRKNTRRISFHQQIEINGHAVLITS